MRVEEDVVGVVTAPANPTRFLDGGGPAAESNALLLPEGNDCGKAVGDSGVEERGAAGLTPQILKRRFIFNQSS